MYPGAVLLAALVSAASFAGCLGGSNPEESTDLAPEESTEAPDTETNDTTSPSPSFTVTSGEIVLEPSLPPQESTEAPTPSPTPPAPDAAPTPAPAPTPEPTPAPTPAPAAPPAAAPAPSPTPPPPSVTPSPTPTPPPPEPTWPREGSFVRYRTTGGEGSPDGSFGMDYRNDITLRYQDGQWVGVCEGTSSGYYRTFDDDDGGYDYRWDNRTYRESVTLAPARAPTGVSVGQEVAVPVFERCHAATYDIPVVRQETHSAPHTDGVTSWYAHRQEVWPQDRHAWWDADEGFVLAWDHAQRHTANHGWLVDTDLRLTR